jgi:hypothetical protein
MIKKSHLWIKDLLYDVGCAVKEFQYRRRARMLFD